MSAANDAHDWNPARYARDARFVADMAASLVDWLDPAPGERILDLGCGDGALTAAIAERGARVRGVDASPAFVAAARERGIEAEQGDGQTLAYDNAFDGVFSNAALHWMSRDPAAVIRGVHRALVPGGRFVAEFGAKGNVAPIHEALRAEAAARGLAVDALDPWFYPDPESYLEQLESAGFSIEREESFERPTPLPGDVADWLRTLAGPFVNAFEAGAARDAYVAAVRARLVAAMYDAEDGWVAPYVRLRFRAVKH